LQLQSKISLVFSSSLLIIGLFFQQSASGQLSSRVTYEARDSIVAHIPSQKVRLYGEAIVEFENITLTADFIEVDLKMSEVTATFSLDSLGQPIGKPVFTSDGEESRCDYIKYNFNTKKGYIREVRAQQGEGYIHMAESKIHPNEEIHLRDGKFTTCDADTPHYHFKLTRAIIVPDERIVTGPVYMKLFKIPVPLAAPFGFFPNSDTKKHGIIIPRFASTQQYGFGLQDFGYYIPLSDSWETYFYATLFSTGRFGIQNISNYYKKYRFNGGLGLKFEQFRGKFYDTLVANKWSFNWNHSQDAKAHPSLRFSADVNFKSDNNGKTSLDAVNPEYFDNQFNSSVSLSKSWKAGRFSGSMSLKTSLQQNSQSHTYVMEMPSYNLSVNRFNLGVLRRNQIGKKWYENIQVTYQMNAKNRVVAPDSVFMLEHLYTPNDYARNGVQHSTTVQSNLRLFGGRMMFAPTITYKETWNFQYENNEWNPNTEKVDTTEINGFLASRYLNFAANTTSNFYGYYRLSTPAQTRFRHVASTSVGFSYVPEMGLHQKIQVDSAANEKYYSPFQNSLYAEPAGAGTSGNLSFTLANTFEMKKINRKDTLNESVKHYKLVDVLSVNTAYDIFKDSFNLSNFTFAFRTARFLNVFSFQSNAVVRPYTYNTITGGETPVYSWNSGQGIGTLRSGTVAVTANFTNSKGRKKQNALDEATSDNAITNGIATSPGLMSFDIPWQVNLSYNLNYTRGPKQSGLTTIDTINLIQTIRADGDFSITEKWKFQYGVNFDLQAQQADKIVTNYNFSIWRDLHCWEASLAWTQYGPFGDKKYTFLFRVNIKASMFQDIKLEMNKPPFFF
jgi:hypothetical protein